MKVQWVTSTVLINCSLCSHPTPLSKHRLDKLLEEKLHEKQNNKYVWMLHKRKNENSVKNTSLSTDWYVY